MTRVLDLSEFAAGKGVTAVYTAGWTIAPPPDCGMPSCRTNHDELFGIFIARSRRLGREMLMLQLGWRLETPFGWIIERKSLVLHGGALDEFWADLDEVKGAMGR